MDQPRLAGEKIYLRPIELADLEGPYIYWLNDPEVTRYLEVGHTRQTPESLRKYLKRFETGDSDTIYAICESETHSHIGNVTLNNINRFSGIADTGLMIGDKSCWGKGYAFDAWRLILGFAFSELKLRKIVAGAIVDNVASIRTLEKLGFRREGVLRGEATVDGEPCDVVRFGLFREEFLGG